MKRQVVALAALALLAPMAGAATITQWNFNSNPGDANTGTGTTAPAIGSGTIATVGGVTSTFASGDASGGSSDPNVGDDSGLNTTTYAAQGAEDKSRGIRFDVSTVGFFDIGVTFDTRHSNTSANTVVLQYTLDGSVGAPVWVDAATFTANAGDTWFNGRSADLSAVAGLNNNATAAFRVVASFAPTGGYVASSPTGSYGPTGTLRYDMVTVSGTVIPEPAAGALILTVLAIAASRRR